MKDNPTEQPDSSDELREPCDKAPKGWYCTRARGHDGPCAALPVGNILFDEIFDKPSGDKAFYLRAELEAKIEAYLAADRPRIQAEVIEAVVSNLGMFTQPLSELADVLTDLQASVCSYGTRDGDGKTCDCKYGCKDIKTGKIPLDEQSGCPELRMAARLVKQLDTLCKQEGDTK